MARRSTACTQADITRLIKAAVAAGYKEHITGVRLDREGATLLFKPTTKLLKMLEEPATDETGMDDTSWSDVDAA